MLRTGTFVHVFRLMIRPYQVGQSPGY